MNCSEIEKQIYCYRELDDRERAETDQHLESCDACREIMENVNTTTGVVEAWRKATSTLVHEARMTSRIMEAVRKAQTRGASAWRPFLRLQEIRSMRLAMAAVSLFLVVSFLGEYAKDTKAPHLSEHHSPQDREQQIELDLASFHSALYTEKRNERPDGKSISQCVRDCLHKRNRDCSDCAGKYSKP